MFRLLSMTLLIPLLISCVVIKSYVQLAPEFEKNAEVIPFKVPNWRFTDAVYNQKLAQYHIEDSDVFEISGKSTQADRHTHHIDLFKSPYLFGSIIDTAFDVEGISGFSFVLKNKSKTKAEAKCESFYSDEVEKRIYKKMSGKQMGEERERAYRLTTYLICAITQENSRWTLNLKSDPQRNLTASLISKDTIINLQVLTDLYQLFDRGNGVERIDRSTDSYNGFSFWEKNKQIAAVSQVGSPKIWIDKSVNNDLHEILLTASYSLSMFEWLDNKWNR